MEDFCKLYETEYGQILVIKDTSSDDYVPEIQVHFILEDEGQVSNNLKFADTDEGWDKRDKAFEEFTVETALTIVESVQGMLE